MNAPAACPHCGGVNGYEALLVLRYIMSGAWGEEWETTGHETVQYKSPSAKCVDCGKRVPLKLAAGATPECPPP